ncbi:NPCBM/NEW2 domain-containing protein [Ferroacidibacillus organovorans]|uniref:Copper amine oxidase-like N-terminal domain-containing protein n=1 Tax=Ferroacidibacillus organovorans TaxID=1765683 RepID=A0A117SXM0_9BACL|nr:NPCBM/NEW2 domain-containing protein [Ferroacidibacillus organovorans]KUO95721.1 hypothetical protein ATW55_13300 [Ferroacidibacillus organovorans]
MNPRPFVLGAVTSLLLAGGTAYASATFRHIEASYANISIQVNGKPVPTSAEPFIYNKNVYVPISTVGHALGANVQWINNPATVKVTPSSTVHPVSVYYNGQALPSGITDGSTFLDVPASSTAYTSVTGLLPTIDSAGNVDIKQSTPPAFPTGSTPLVLSMQPTHLYGDFANTNLYPKGQLSGYWNATVLGQLYPGIYTMEWGVVPGTPAQVPGVDYALNGKYTTFSGTLAIDDLSKNYGGAVQLVFLGDGKTIGQTGWAQGGTEPISFSVPVSGVQTLEIQYEVKGPNGNIHMMGSTYTPPAVNPDGSKTDPILVVDLMNAALQ